MELVPLSAPASSNCAEAQPRISTIVEKSEFHSKSPRRGFERYRLVT
jgi:hypothetical protein